MKKQFKAQIEILTKPGEVLQTSEIRVCGVKLIGVESWDIEEYAGNLGRMTIRVCAPVVVRSAPRNTKKSGPGMRRRVSGRRPRMPLE